MGKKGLGRRLSMKTTTIMLDYDGINLFMFRSQSGLASAFLDEGRDVGLMVDPCLH